MQHITGIIQHGKQLGRTLGFPTANIFCDTKDIEAGTRRVNVGYHGKLWRGVGPYFPERKLFEVHILDIDEEDQELYGKEITIYPLKHIRENKQFERMDDLRKQIILDSAYVRHHDITVMTFGTFDYFHLGHRAYLSQAKARGDRLVTVIALDETVERIKDIIPTHTQEERKQAVEASGCVDSVVLGDPHNHYQCLLDWQPDVICLGYDQHSFDTGLQTFYTGQGRDLPTIVRLEAFDPHIYKSSLVHKRKKL